MTVAKLYLPRLDSGAGASGCEVRRRTEAVRSSRSNEYSHITIATPSNPKYCHPSHRPLSSTSTPPRRFVAEES